MPMLYKLSSVNIHLPAWVFMAFLKSCSIDSKKWRKYKMWSGAWDTAHLRNLLPNTYQASTVSTALEWWSRGHWFNPDWGQFLTKFLCSSLCGDLSDNLTETRIVKNPNESTVGDRHSSLQSYLTGSSCIQLIHFESNTRTQNTIGLFWIWFMKGKFEINEINVEILPLCLKI